MRRSPRLCPRFGDELRHREERDEREEEPEDGRTLVLTEVRLELALDLVELPDAVERAAQVRDRGDHGRVADRSGRPTTTATRPASERRAAHRHHRAALLTVALLLLAHVGRRAVLLLRRAAVPSLRRGATVATRGVTGRRPEATRGGRRAEATAGRRTSGRRKAHRRIGNDGAAHWVHSTAAGGCSVGGGARLGRAESTGRRRRAESTGGGRAAESTGRGGRSPEATGRTRWSAEAAGRRRRTEAASGRRTETTGRRAVCRIGAAGGRGGRRRWRRRGCASGGRSDADDRALHVRFGSGRSAAGRRGRSRRAGLRRGGGRVHHQHRALEFRGSRAFEVEAALRARRRRFRILRATVRTKQAAPPSLRPGSPPSLGSAGETTRRSASRSRGFERRGAGNHPLKLGRTATSVPRRPRPRGSEARTHA